MYLLIVKDIPALFAISYLLHSQSRHVPATEALDDRQAFKWLNDPMARWINSISHTTPRIKRCAHHGDTVNRESPDSGEKITLGHFKPR
jgi:hypothetical protein